MSAQEVTAEMTAFMKELRGKVAIGVVGGSDTTKIKEQLGDDCKHPLALPFAVKASAVSSDARGLGDGA